MRGLEAEVSLVDILDELRKINENLTALAITLSRNPGRQPSLNAVGYPSSGPVPDAQHRTALAVEQLNRPGHGQQVAAVRVAGAAEPSVKSAAPTWGLELGSASLVLDMDDAASE